MDFRIERALPSTTYSNSMKKNKKSDISFKNGLGIASALNSLTTSGFRYMDANKIVGPTVVDIVSMIGPRTLVDTMRNIYAGIETFIRESMGLVTNCLTPGFIGMGLVKFVLGKNIDKDYGINSSRILADNKSLDVLHNIWKEKPGNVRNYVEKIFESTEGLTENGWTAKINTSKKKAIYDDFAKLINNDKNGFEISSKDLKGFVERIGTALGARDNLRIQLSEKVKTSTKLDDLVRDTYAVGKAFLKTETKGKSVDSLVEGLKKLSIKKTVMGLVIICSIASTVQAINRYFTRKKSGKKGFPGYCDFTKSKEQTDTIDRSTKFKSLKLAAAGLMAGIFYLSIGSPKSIGKFIEKVQFKRKFPTTDQIKIVYASVIMGRLLAAEDKNEFRETALRDYFGFLNYLVIGDFIVKGVTQLFKDKSLLNKESSQAPTGFWNRVKYWLTDIHVKSHDEVLDKALKDLGIDRAKEIAGKKWSQLESNILIKAIKNVKGEEKQKIAQETLKKLSSLNKAQLSGYIYSCLMLGFLVPSFNRIVTDKARKRELAKQNAICDMNERIISNDQNTNERHSCSVISKKTYDIYKDFLNDLSKAG